MSLSYHDILIVSKYFNDINDYINLAKTNKNYNILNLYRYNPIDIIENNKITLKYLKFFPNIETLHIYNDFNNTNFYLSKFTKRFKNIILWKRINVSYYKYYPNVIYKNVYKIIYDNTDLNEFLNNKIINEANFKYNAIYDYKNKILDLSQLKIISGYIHNNEIETILFNNNCDFDARLSCCYKLKNIDTLFPLNYLNSFYKCTSLSKIILSKNVKVIPEGCFSNCSNLMYINLKDVEKIEEEAFYKCTSLGKLQDINLENIKEIGCFAFCGCNNLKNIELKNIEKLDNAFYKCKNLNNNFLMNIARLKYLHDDNVYCKNYFQPIYLDDLNLEHLDLPYNSIFEFKDIRNLTKMTNLSHLNVQFNYINNKYKGCNILKNIVIINTFEYVDISNLTKLTYLGHYTFKNCENLKIVVLPDSLKKISKSCFSDCYNLKLVYQKSLININKDINYENMNIIDYENDIIDEDSFAEGSIKNENDENMNIIDYESNDKNINNGIYLKVDDIFEEAFKNCLNIKYADIIVGYIDRNCFKNCSGIKKVKINSGNNLYSSTFNGCINLKEVNIHFRNMKYYDLCIYNNNFNECYNLKNINIYISLDNFKRTSNFNIRFYNNSFNNCSISKINIIDKSKNNDKNIVLYINSSAFKNCHNFKGFYGDYKINRIAKHSFINCYNLDISGFKLNRNAKISKESIVIDKN